MGSSRFKQWKLILHHSWTLAVIRQLLMNGNNCTYEGLPNHSKKWEIFNPFTVTNLCTWKYIITALPSSKYSTLTRTVWSKHLKMGKYCTNSHTINVTMYLNKNKLSKHVNHRTVHVFTHSARKWMHCTSPNLHPRTEESIYFNCCPVNSAIASSVFDYWTGLEEQWHLQLLENVHGTVPGADTSQLPDCLYKDTDTVIWKTNEWINNVRTRHTLRTYVRHA